MGGNNEFFENLERNKYLKKLPSMQRVNDKGTTNTNLFVHFQSNIQVDIQTVLCIAGYSGSVMHCRIFRQLFIEG